MSIAGQIASKSSVTKIAIAVVGCAVVAGAALYGKQMLAPNVATNSPSGDARSTARGDEKNDALRSSESAVEMRVADVKEAGGPQALQLPGTLCLDPNRLIHVHSRFGGEAISIGTTDDGQGGVRTLRFGDRVKRGQLLAVVWSKEIGEKKSELLDAISLLETNEAISARLDRLAPGLVTERAKEEARHDVEVAKIAVAKAERTLRSWRMTDEEFTAIYDELRSIRKSANSKNPEVEKRWAEIDIRSAIEGMIVEKSFNVGDMVEQSDDLFKVADLSRLQVMANVYEEDLHPLRALKPEERLWTIDLKSDPADNRIPGRFDLIGRVIDPNQRTGVVMGWIDNPEGTLAVGQFITATISLPHPAGVVAIPAAALIEDGEAKSVLVEVDRARGEYARRGVSIVRRGLEVVYVFGLPSSSGEKPLQAGERVVVNGVPNLDGDSAILRTASSKSR